MEKILIFYGTEEFNGSLIRLKKEAKSLNIFDKIIVYTPKDLPIQIKASPLMNYKKGGGYWIWKPYIIWKTLQDNPDSSVIYLDSGCSVLQSNEWNEYFELIKTHDTILFQYRNDFDYQWDKLWPTATTKIINWTKLSTQEYFDGLIKSNDWHSYEKIMGGFIICKNSKNEFIDQWLKISLFKPELVTDPFGNELENQNIDFIEHRHDQSIITPLAYYFFNKKNKLIILPETSESKLGSPAVLATRFRTQKKLTYKQLLYIKLRNLFYKLKK